MAKLQNKVSIEKEEFKGLKWVFFLYFISWGLLIVNIPYIPFIAWLSLGLIGFVLYKIVDKLNERGEKNG